MEELKNALLTNTITAELMDKVGNILVIVSDKKQKQFTGLQFLGYYCNVRVLALWDPACHGLWNLVKLGLAEAVFEPVFRESQILVNWRADLVMLFKVK